MWASLRGALSEWGDGPDTVVGTGTVFATIRNLVSTSCSRDMSLTIEKLMVTRLRQAYTRTNNLRRMRTVAMTPVHLMRSRLVAAYMAR